MAWLEAATNYLATLSYKLIRGDSGEGGRRRRETHRNYNGTEWNSQQYPSGSQNFGHGYGHGGEYYGQGGSEKHYRGNNPQEQNSQQYPSGSQNFGHGYGHGGEYYGQGGSEKHYRGNNPQEQRYSFHILDEDGESEVNVVTSQGVEEKGDWRALFRRIDYEESGTITKQYVDSNGKPVVERTPYRSRMYEENQYIPFGAQDGTRMNAAASVPREVAKRRRKKKRWSFL